MQLLSNITTPLGAFLVIGHPLRKVSELAPPGLSELPEVDVQVKGPGEIFLGKLRLFDTQ